MKSSGALAVAALLGLAGAVLNLYYLTVKSRDVAKVEFIGISEGATIHPGDRFTEEKLVPVAIPKSGLGELPHFAVLYADRNTVVGMPALRLYTGGELLLRQDLRTPPPTLLLNSENERAMWIPVDTRTFVPSLVNPGDMVSFLVGGLPTPAPPGRPNEGGSPEEPDASQPVPAGPPGGRGELIGPFRVLSLGNRLASADVQKASGAPQLQENVITISVTVQGDQLEPKAAKLWQLLQTSGMRQAGVVLHPRITK